jgi:hypothetical protein
MIFKNKGSFCLFVCGAEIKTQGFTNARHVFYHQIIPQPYSICISDYKKSMHLLNTNFSEDFLSILYKKSSISKVINSAY